jgi:GNAT superfamily N-acetyltransferase
VTVTVRHRVDLDLDLDSCERIAREVSRVDGYPVYGSEDLRAFIAVPDALDAWVAEKGDQLIGHAAIRPGAPPGVIAMASELMDWPSDRRCVLSRLVVAPTARHRGIGSLLLETAVHGALDPGRWPVLDVVASSPAVAFYERGGWTRAGIVRVSLPDGSALDEVVFVWPGTAGRDADADHL